MTPATFISLYILLIFLPGLAATYIVQFLATRNMQTDFDKFIEAAVYSCLIYATFMLSHHGSLPFKVKESSVEWESGSLIVLTAIAIGFALLGTAYINLDGNRIFRRLGITERTARRSIWNDVLENEAKPTQPVQVELADGRSIYGILSYYSDSADDCSLYIESAFIVDSAGRMINVPGPGILLTKNAAIKSINLR